MASTVGEKKRTWLKPLMRGVAIVLALVGSFAGFWATFSLQLQQSGNGEGWAVIGVVLLGAVSAVLFRSWWALLVIPIAFALGELLAYTVLNPPPLDMAGGLWMVIGPMTAILGALIGTAVGIPFRRWWEMRKIRKQTKSLYIH